MSRTVRVRILQVPGCARVGEVRETVRRSLSRVHLQAEVEEEVGDYASPTLLIDGRDVTHPLAAPAPSSCRLDLPSEPQVLSALLGDEIRGAAFRRLFGSESPALVEDVAADVGQPPEAVQAAAGELGRRGQLRLDGQGRIAGSAGLSVAPDRHQVEIAGRRFWTWCAYDILGIFGALRATGAAASRDPLTGEALEVRFVDGRPKPTGLVLFRPDGSWQDCCANVYEDWCPNSNLFTGREEAVAWAAARGLSGLVWTLDEASGLATRDWEPLAAGDRIDGLTH